MQTRYHECQLGAILNNPTVTVKQDQISELWKKIWDTLMIYFDSEDSSVKLEKKELLIELMTEFLGRVPHNMKFYCSSVSSVLFSAARGRHRPFRPLALAKAFDTLHQYAVRAITQPWRAEYTTLNLYCGHYVHTVLSCLESSDAGLLLAEMGFVVDPARGQARLVEPDVDQLTKVAIDTLMAATECRIVQCILERLCCDSVGPDFSASQVMAYRAEFVCDVSSAVGQLRAVGLQTQLCRDLSALQPSDLATPRLRESTAHTPPLTGNSRANSTDNLIQFDEENVGKTFATAKTTRTPLLPTTLDQFNLTINKNSKTPEKPTNHTPLHTEDNQRHQRSNTPVSSNFAQNSPGVATSADIGTWSCHACTFINTPTCNICTMCGKTRLRQSLSPSLSSVTTTKTKTTTRASASTSSVTANSPDVTSSDGDIACSVCTLLNKRAAKRCSACQSVLRTA